MSERVIYKCTLCMSEDVVCDAWAVWDERHQEWRLGTVHGDFFCRACETTLTETECRLVLSRTPQEVYVAKRAAYRKAHNLPTGLKGRENIDFRK